MSFKEETKFAKKITSYLDESEISPELQKRLSNIREIAVSKRKIEVGILDKIKIFFGIDSKKSDFRYGGQGLVIATFVFTLIASFNLFDLNDLNPGLNKQNIEFQVSNAGEQKIVNTVYGYFESADVDPMSEVLDDEDNAKPTVSL